MVRNILLFYAVAAAYFYINLRGSKPIIAEKNGHEKRPD
jgi:hypothetical protein